MPVTPNQSYYLKEIHLRTAGCLAALMHDLGSDSDWAPGAYIHPLRVCYTPSHWRKDHQSIYLRGPQDEKAFVFFSNARWDPEASEIIRGQKRIAENVEVSDDSKTKIIRNDTDGPIHVAYEESVGLTNSFSSRVTKGLTLDVTTSEETTVTGEYPGVSAEVKVSESLGVSKSEEQEKDEAEEGTQGETVSIEFDASPGCYYLVTITKDHEQTEEPFDINGVFDFDIHMRLTEDWWKRRNCKYLNHHDIHVQGVAGLLQFYHGYDTNHPEMEGYSKHAVSRIANGINWIAKSSNRRVQVSGVNEASLESNADYRVELLGNRLPGGMAHLPVVQAEDVGR